MQDDFFGIEINIQEWKILMLTVLRYFKHSQSGINLQYVQRYLVGLMVLKRA